MTWEEYRGFINVPLWVKKTVEAIESANTEARYFCRLCGFSVILPVEAEIRLVTGSDGQTGFLVGQKNHLPPGAWVRRCSWRRCGCPFHPDVELWETAYKRDEDEHGHSNRNV